MKKLKRYVPKIYLGSELLYNFNRAIRFEWIVTNGLGGYASSTVLNINTRKFHGLLFVAFNPPVSRHLLLSKIDEEIQVGNDRFPLNSNEFRDKVYPEGYKNLKSFALQPFPTFHYQIHEVYMRKEVFMPHLKSMVIIIYEVFNVLNDDISMNLYPLVNMRHFYETTDKNDLQFSQSQIPNGVMLESHPNTGYLAIFSTIGKYIPNRNIWIERIYFRTDDSRGEDCLDDNYQPGFFQINLPPKKISRFHVVAIGGKRKEEVNLLFSAASERRFLKNLYLEEINRREKLLKRFYEEKAEVKQEDWLDWLILSADSFIVNRKTTGKKSIIAGYHWFEDWGRDSLIALPGLTLITGRFRDAEEIILNFKQYCRSGLMPNRFPDKSGDEPVYDSVDATLWFFNAVLQYLKYTGNFDFVAITLTKPGIGAVLKVSDVFPWDTHQFTANSVHRNDVETGESNLMINWSTTTGSVAFHAFGTVENTEIWCSPGCHHELVVVDHLGRHFVIFKCVHFCLVVNIEIRAFHRHAH